MLSCEAYGRSRNEDADDESMVGYHTVYMDSIVKQIILFYSSNCNCLILLYLNNCFWDSCPFTCCLHLDRSVNTISLVLWFLVVHNLKLVGIVLCEKDIIPLMPLLTMAIVGV